MKRYRSKLGGFKKADQIFIRRVFFLQPVPSMKAAWRAARAAGIPCSYKRVRQLLRKPWLRRQREARRP